MPNLILLTNAFPYGNWEPYLETEVQYYEPFDQVYVCSLQIRPEHAGAIRPLPSDKFHVHPVFYAKKWVYLLNAVTCLGDKNFYRELKKLAKQHRLTPGRLVSLCVYLSRAHYEARSIRNYLKAQGVFDQGSRGILYSYRFEYQPYVGILLQKQLPGYRLVARGHGYDLYEERHHPPYIPCREILLAHLDQMYPVAEHGLNYLAEQYPEYSEKLEVLRLGTLDHGVTVTRLGDVLNIVSCSTLTPVKRVHLIIEALKKLEDVRVNWTHYGEGPLSGELEELSKTLPENIRCQFRGFVDNAVLLAEYQEKPYHLFLNVSSSEGIPVSIMEPLSFGIPCIATDVGGTREIVTDGDNGVLLDADFTPEELAGHLRRFAEMAPEEYQRYRARARESWEARYNAETNYRQFAAHLAELAEK